MDDETLRKILKEELSPIKDDVSSLKEDVSSLKEGQQGLKQGIEDIKAMIVEVEAKNATRHTQIEGHLKNIDETIDAVKQIIGRHEVDITVLQRRPV
jgi:predicted  nucleic acid-binding Zn-ribbon protein